MLIQSSNYLNRNYVKPTFTEYRNAKVDSAGNIIYRKDTCSFRHDLYFDKFVDFLDLKYKYAEDVDVVIHACSVGEEAYSLAAQMDYSLGKRADKFKPLKARDIDADCIKMAERPVYSFYRYERDHANFCLKGMLDYYYKLIETDRYYEKRVPADFLKDFVKFGCSDILEDVKNMRSNNTVLLARNLWPYLSKEKAVILLYEIAKKFDKSCTLVIGDFDKECDIERLLTKFKFRKTFLNNVYEKTIDSLPPIRQIQLDFEYKEIIESYLAKTGSSWNKYLYRLKHFIKFIN